MPAFGMFVTGTDTGVGKTEVSSAVLRALVARGLVSVGMKPVAAGCRRVGRVLRNSDVERLRAASNVRARRHLVSPYAFAPPIAPHIAAAAVDVQIDLKRICSAYRMLCQQADAVVVEGVGGFLAPLGARCDGGDLARVLGLPVLLVVGVRLGCLNHALLTAEAIRHRGLVLAGWVASRVTPAMRAGAENVRALSERLDAPMLGDVPFTRSPRARALAFDTTLDVDLLLQTVRAKRA